MKAARLVGARTFRVGSHSAPEPGPDQVLFRVEGCGICGSNLPPWKGEGEYDFPFDAGSPGHEAWGRVEAVGPAVGGRAAGTDGPPLEPGRRIAALSYRAFAEYDVADADQVVPLPPALEGRAVPAEPLACAVNVTRRAGVREGDVVVLLGVGFLGALLLPLLRAAGPSHVFAVSRRRTALEMAERMGADEALGYDEVRARVEALTGGRRADVVVEATGAQGPLDLAAELARVRGRLVVAGYHQDGPRTVDMRLWNWRGLDVINAHERDPAVYLRGMREGVRRMAEGSLDPDPLLTHTVPLTDIQRGFEQADRRDPGFFKAVVVPE